MDDKKLKSQELENPTLALKVSSLLSKSWNRDLRDEQVHQDTISRLRGNPIQIVSSDKSEERDWTTERLVNAFDSYGEHQAMAIVGVLLTRRKPAPKA